MSTLTVVKVGSITTGLPTSGYLGEVIDVVNSGVATETLVRSSDLILRTPALAFGPGSYLRLYWNGAAWVELFRVVMPDPSDVTDFAADTDDTVKSELRVVAGEAAPESGTWNPGDRVLYTGAAVAAAGKEGLICVTGGTDGKTLGQGGVVTGTGVVTVVLDGAPTDPVEIGDWVDFDSADEGRVVSVSDDGLTLTVESGVAEGTITAVEFFASAWKTFGAITA